MPLKFFKNLIIYGSLLSSIALFFLNDVGKAGNLALLVLTLVIFTKPAVKLFPTITPFKYLLTLRRQTGQAAAFLALSHVLITLGLNRQAFSKLVYYFMLGPAYFQFWGVTAIILMLPLLITSNDFSTRLLKRNWFLLHKLIHPLYIFVLIHYGLQKGPLVLTLCVLLLILLYTSRFLAGQNVQFFKPPPPSL